MDNASGKMQVSDRIEKQVVLKAPRSKVWQALTDAKEFGEWFQVKLNGQFALGQKIKGQITYPGYEHYPFEAEVTALDEPELFAYRWPQFDPELDYSAEPWTLVEFRLADAPGGGTLLTITESGFNALAPKLREKAFLGNSEGWEEQTKNIKQHVEG